MKRITFMNLFRAGFNEVRVIRRAKICIINIGKLLIGEIIKICDDTYILQEYVPIGSVPEGCIGFDTLIYICRMYNKNRYLGAGKEDNIKYIDGYIDGLNKAVSYAYSLQFCNDCYIQGIDIYDNEEKVGEIIL